MKRQRQLFVCGILLLTGTWTASCRPDATADPVQTELPPATGVDVGSPVPALTPGGAALTPVQAASLVPGPADETRLARIDLLTLVGPVMISHDRRHVAWVEQANDEQIVRLDGKEDGRAYDSVEVWGFSPDSQRLLYFGVRDEQRFVVLDGQETGPYEEVTYITFSRDSRRVAFLASVDGQWRVVIDGEGENPFDGGWPRLFSFTPDGKGIRLGFSIPVNGQQAVVIDGETHKSYDEIGDEIWLSPDGRRTAYSAFTDGQWFLVLDGKEGQHYPELVPDENSVSPLAFSPDSQRFAYMAVEAEGYRMIVDEQPVGRPFWGIGWGEIFSPDSQKVAFRGNMGIMVVDGIEGKTYFNVGNPVFSPDSQRLAYAATESRPLGNDQYEVRSFVVVDGVEGKAYEGEFAIASAPVFSPDSRRVAYAVRLTDRQFVIVDGTEGRVYDAVGQITFSPDSRHVAYAASQGERQFVVVDGMEGRPFDWIIPWEIQVGDIEAGTARQIPQPLPFSHTGSKAIVFDAPDRFHYLALRGFEIYLIEEAIP